MNKMLRKVNDKENKQVEKFDRVVGYKEIKDELMQLRKFLHQIDTYRKFGVRIPRGVLLYGEPGVGKTVMARSIADDGIALVEVRAADCCENDTVSRLQSAFEQARNQAPSILLLDELDKIAGTSMNFFMESNDDTRKVLLQELDKLTANDGVLVVATCNDLSELGDALVRSGRFDRIINVEGPTEKERKLILQCYFDKLKLKVTASCKELARITPCYTGAELECIVNESGLVAMNGNHEVTMSIVQKVINKLAFHGGVVSDKHQVAVHEAGHALVALILSPDNLFGASVISQGSSAGHVQFVGREELRTSQDEEDAIAVMLAGRVAEREVLGKIYLGSRSDLNRAYKKASNLVVDNAIYGYQYFLGENEKNMPGVPIPASVKEKIFEVLNRMDAVATDIIKKHRKTLDVIVSELEKKLVLDRKDLVAILKSDKNLA